MTGFVIAAIMVAATGPLIVLLVLLVKTSDVSVLAGLAAIGLVTVVIGSVINASIKESEKGPCHQYETKMTYNAATKTTMPSRVCVLRGEWVDDEEEP